MKILQVISTLDKSSGGPARSVPKLCENIAGESYQVILVSKEERNPVKLYVNENFSHKNIFFWQAVGFIRRIKPDIIHLQHIWSPYIHVFAAICHVCRIPYLVTPRGMLEPWILNRNPLRKKLGLFLYQRHDLRKSACIHVTCEAERRQIRSLGFRNPLVLIPNGIDLKLIPYRSVDKASRVILFISRIHPKKGIEILLEAWRCFEDSGWKLMIAGEGDEMYVRKLKQRIAAYQLKSVRLVGAQYDDDKWGLFEQAELFILPSYSENFGIAIAESLAMGVPVITTRDTPWAELETHRCGWWIDLSVDNVIKSIREAISLTSDQRRDMGERGRKLIEQNYEISGLAIKMRTVYDWLSGLTERPACVTLPAEEYPVKHALRVMFFITSIDQSCGGTTAYIELIAPYISTQADMVLVTGTSPSPVILEGVRCHFLNMNVTNYPKLVHQFRNIILDENPDVIHINGIWQPQTWWFQRIAQELGKQVILSPHGMLEPWILNRNYLKKSLALFLYQRKAISNANYLHATAETELEHFRNLGFMNQAFVVPNGIDLKASIPKEQWYPVRQILFLSRVHPKKGIELLIDAVSKLNNATLRVVVAGSGESQYVEQLKNRCKEKGVDRQFNFSGAVYGNDKWQLYHDSDLFVLPTYSENFGIVVAEALATGLPVITTTGTPWKILEEYNCGYWIEPEVESLMRVLNSVLEMTGFELQELGENGIKLVNDLFSIRTVTNQLLEHYRSI